MSLCLCIQAACVFPTCRNTPNPQLCGSCPCVDPGFCAEFCPDTTICFGQPVCVNTFCPGCGMKPPTPVPTTAPMTTSPTTSACLLCTASDCQSNVLCILCPGCQPTSAPTVAPITLSPTTVITSQPTVVPMTGSYQDEFI